ncbi:LPS export ABC transporter permease LptG [Paracoccus sp. Z118]|uniref:LPS export ABC transporter permease LptG n=1 Tax=Paracoccus sp. Z118 TaxID=2851017 RepID=UPI001C2C3E89|nr:LPS export ABC transporter permease LptG [Paracoccus sp. Z118]MBV0890560.1 LPS export ABC transporter permease LptG [Paracoccus sp. Z118]
MILQLYLSRRWLRQLAIVGGAFLAILFLIDLVEQIRRFGDEGIGLGGTAALAALNIAGSYYSIMPLIVLLAGIALFLAMSRSSEMVAIRASGRSGLRAVMAPAITAALFGAAAVAVLNPVVAGTEKRYDAAVARIGSEGQQTVSLGEGGLWLRQGLPPLPAGTAPAEGRIARAAGGQVVIRASRASPDATTLYNPTFIIFSPDLGPTHRIEAEAARLEPGAWQLTGVKEWPLDVANPEAAAQALPTLRLPTELTAARIRDGFGSPAAVPIWQLPEFIAGLESAGFSALRHQVWFQMELSLPFLMAAMILIAAAFTMRPVRGRRVSLLVLGAFAAGLGLFFLRNLAQVLGETGQVPPVMAAFAPPTAAALLALALLLRLEEG